MKSVKLSGPKNVEISEAEKPGPGSEKLVIKLERCGICGSDIHIWENGRPEGLIMGHEFSGTIEDPGAAKDMFQPGDRVTALPSNPCGTCVPCKKNEFNRCLNMLADSPGITTPGAFAEYMAISCGSVRKIPDGMSFDEAAMVEPSAVALHAVNLAGIRPGDRVLIVGGGIIGLLSAAWARRCAAAYIALSEVNSKRAEKGMSFGDIDEVFDAKDPKIQKKLLTASQGGFDKVIECAGPAPAVKSAIGGASQGAVVVLAGINYSEVPISTMRIAMREITLKGSYAYTENEFDQCIDYIARKVLNAADFIDKSISFEGVQDAFVQLADPSGNAVKIMVKI